MGLYQSKKMAQDGILNPQEEMKSTNDKYDKYEMINMQVNIEDSKNMFLFLSSLQKMYLQKISSKDILQRQNCIKQ